MFAALTLFVVLTLSVMMIRIAAVALRITGLPADIARFQARSAFTGAGFTTSESEAIVNHPARRQIVSLLMVVGNMGLVSVLATVIVSLVGSSEREGALLEQLSWLAGVLLFLLGVAMNPRLDRVMCAAVERLLRRSRWLAKHGPEMLLQCPNDSAVYRIRVENANGEQAGQLGDRLPSQAVALGLRRIDGSYLNRPSSDERLEPNDEIYLYSSAL